ncbi:unnamed protein product [Heligmosomoides polygyrus]|uniref:F-box domain-containing protein n=1 Tax=Heligmosomoides polygyrus TaxID=6339 RepID=A0A183G241_HELPZ|nr:unnamed protein product [Heligmosomoides polygyrus]
MPTLVWSSSDDGCQASPLTAPFPWSRLPPELRVEVLTYLRRRDLAQCRLVNHEMMEMISASEGSMRRRQLDLVRIERIGNGRVQLSMKCDEEGKSRKWVAYQRRKRRRGADVATHMKMDKRVIRGIYLYEFKLGTTAKEADEKINAAFGQGCSTIRTAYRWYQKFRNGDESLEEHEGRGRQSDVDEDKLRDVVEEDPYKGTREIAKVLGVSHNTAARHLKEIGKTKDQKAGKMGASRAV